MAITEDNVIVDSGYGKVTNAAPSLTLLSTLTNANTGYRIKSGYIGITLAATGGTGLVELRDSDNTVLLTVPADSLGFFSFDVEPGIDVTLNKGVKVVATGAGTNEATAVVGISARRIHGS
jgi:hypothetical protein